MGKNKTQILERIINRKNKLYMNLLIDHKQYKV